MRGLGWQFIMTPVVFVRGKCPKKHQKLGLDYRNTPEIEGCKNCAGQ